MTTITPAYNVQQIEAFQFRGAASESAMQTAGASINAALYGLDTSGSLVGSVPSGIYAINSLVNSTSAVYGLNGGLAAMLGTTFNPTTNPTTGTVSAQLANATGAGPFQSLTSLTARAANTVGVSSFNTVSTTHSFQNWVPLNGGSNGTVTQNSPSFLVRDDTGFFVVNQMGNPSSTSGIGTPWNTGVSRTQGGFPALYTITANFNSGTATWNIDFTYMYFAHV